MEIEHTEQILAVLAQNYELELNDATVEIWHACINHLTPEQAKQAMIDTISDHEFSKVKPADLLKRHKRRQRAGLPVTLRITPNQALGEQYQGLLMVQEAARQANLIAPGIDAKMQFSSLEEMHRAHAINRSQWERVFKDQFQMLQDRALELVELEHQNAKEAIKLVCKPRQALPSNLIKLIDRVTNGKKTNA